MNAPRQMGPYETERQARNEPMPRAVTGLHQAGRVRSGDPDRLVRDTVLRHLDQACEATGVEMAAFDRSMLAWLANWEPENVQVVIGMITRAYTAGAAWAIHHVLANHEWIFYPACTSCTATRGAACVNQRTGAPMVRPHPGRRKDTSENAPVPTRTTTSPDDSAGERKAPR